MTTVDLTEVEERLSALDRIHFRAWCRNWLRYQLGLGGDQWCNNWQNSIYEFEHEEDAIIFKLKFIGYR